MLFALETMYSKMARCIQELERIKGITHGGDRKSNGDNLDLKSTQSNLANEINISQQQLGDYKKLLKLIPELQQMIENGLMQVTNTNMDVFVLKRTVVYLIFFSTKSILTLSTGTKLHLTKNDDGASLHFPKLDTPIYIDAS